MDWVGVVIRAIHLASSTLVLGILGFTWMIGDPALRGAGPLPRLRTAPLERWWRQSTRWSAVAAVASGLVDLGRQATVVTEAGWVASLTPTVIDAVVTHTRYGRVWLVRHALLVAIAGILAWQVPRSDGSVRQSQRSATLLAAASLAALSASGHAASAPWVPRLAIVLDAGHLLATGMWFGGLMPLARLLHWAASQGDRAGLRAAVIATRRFSTLGLVAMTTLAVTGAFNVWEHVPSVAALLGTSYGHWLSLKLGLWVLVLGVAGMNRWVVKPRLRAAVAMDERTAADALLRRLRRQVRMELSLGGAILATVAVLGLTAPAHHVHHTSSTRPGRLDWMASCGVVAGRPLVEASAGRLATGRRLEVLVPSSFPRRSCWIPLSSLAKT